VQAHQVYIEIGIRTIDLLQASATLDLSLPGFEKKHVFYKIVNFTIQRSSDGVDFFQPPDSNKDIKPNHDRD